MLVEDRQVDCTGCFGNWSPWQKSSCSNTWSRGIKCIWPWMRGTESLCGLNQVCRLEQDHRLASHAGSSPQLELHAPQKTCYFSHTFWTITTTTFPTLPINNQPFPKSRVMKWALGMKWLPKAIDHFRPNRKACNLCLLFQASWFCSLKMQSQQPPSFEKKKVSLGESPLIAAMAL